MVAGKNHDRSETSPHYAQGLEDSSIIAVVDLRYVTSRTCCLAVERSRDSFKQPG